MISFYFLFFVIFETDMKTEIKRKRTQWGI